MPAVAGAALLWATIGICYRSLTESAGMTTGAVAFVRAAGGGGLLALWLAVKRPHALSVAGRDLLFIAGSAIGSVTILYVLLVEAVQRTAVANAAVCLYTAPAWLALASWAAFGERLSGRRAGGAALTAAGAVLLLVFPSAVAVPDYALFGEGTGGSADFLGPVEPPDGSGATGRLDAPAVAGGRTPARTGVLFGLAAGFVWAASALYGSWKMRGFPPTTVATWSLLIGAVFLLPFAVRTPGALAPVFGSAGAFLTTLFLVAGPTAAGTIVYLRGFARMDPSVAGLVTLVEPVAAAVLAWALLSESPTPGGLAGGALVLAGAVLLTMRERQPAEVEYLN